jgi:C-terminal processing protease CtpA/Prc
MTAIEDKGLKGLVIDLVDNSGGSLIHGMRMLNMLRQKSIQFPSLQVRLNNNWINAFKSQAAFGTDDYSRAIARRVLRDLEQDLQNGKTLSRPFSVRVLDNFFLQNPSYGLKEDVKIVVLVNEFCVSMCDIFASVIQENGLGTLVGQRTMGGGGNVVQHGLSPISKMGLALTESLVLSPKGTYLEDQGVTPEVFVDMVADRESGFQEALRQAQSLLFSPVVDQPGMVVEEAL